MLTISWAAALLAGTLSLLSPCSALLLPSFFAYAFGTARHLLARTGVFTLGLMTTLVPLGVGVQAVARVLYLHRETVITVAGWIIIGLGVLTVVVGGRSLPGTSGLRARTPGLSARSRGGGVLSWVSTWALGAVFGLAGFCAGPALGAILTVAATAGSPWEGGGLLAAYAVGMAVPLFALAWGWERFDLGRRSWLRGRMVRIGPVERHSTTLLAGALFVLVGVLFLAFDGTAGLLGYGPDLTGVERDAQAWLLRAFDGWGWWTLPAAVAVVAVLVSVRRALRAGAADRGGTVGDDRAVAGDVVGGPAQQDRVHPAHVLPQDAQREQLDAPDERHDDDRRGPAGDGQADRIPDQRVGEQQHRDHETQHAGPRRQP